MRFAVFSDSHGNAANLRKIIHYCRANYAVDKFVFLGDGIGDMYDLIGEGLLRYEDVLLVKGNCDRTVSDEEELLFTHEDTRILICHGHRYGVKTTLDYLAKRAHERGAGIALYGHTHIQNIEEKDGVYFVNPGSASTDPNFTILEVDKGRHYAVPII